MYRLYCFICAISLSVFSFFCKAQQSGHLLGQFESRFLELDSMIFSYPQQPLAGSDYFGPATVSADRALSDSLVGRKTDAEIAAFKSKTGLQLSGQTYYRPEGGLGSDENDAVSEYKGKIQAELRWYFFQSSLFRRPGHVKEAQIKGEIERLSSEKARRGDLCREFRERIRRCYDSLAYGVLSHRVYNLSLLVEAQSYLLKNENISSDRLLEVLNEKAEAERMLAAIPRDYESGRSFSGASVVLVRIDTVRFMRAVRANYSELALMQLDMELLSQRRENTTYWTDFRLAPFVRYSYYMRPDISNSSNVDVGLSFTIPLSAEAGKKRKAIDAEREVLALRQSEAAARVMQEVGLVIEDVGRYNRLLEGEVRRAEELKKYIALRSEAYRNRIGEYSRLARMAEYNAYLLCWENLLRYRYARDLRLVDLQEFLSDMAVLDFCELKSVGIN